ncbi:hypothetical protein F4778DRAFT_740446 [Xylariomycetidae sp. FL2044]|nr:hypothetical protein F4778DRAFT_740446 [Xylariomycetidae sp. FL2044]
MYTLSPPWLVASLCLLSLFVHHLSRLPHFPFLFFFFSFSLFLATCIYTQPPPGGLALQNELINPFSFQILDLFCLFFFFLFPALPRGDKRSGVVSSCSW